MFGLIFLYLFNEKSSQGTSDTTPVQWNKAQSDSVHSNTANMSNSRPAGKSSPPLHFTIIIMCTTTTHPIMHHAFVTCPMMMLLVE